MIRLEHVRKEFPRVTPLKDINLTINKGEVISVIGPSGTGKSTLLRCINMLDAPTSGHILVNGTDITAKGSDINRLRQKIGMVFQSFNLFSHMTVIENIMYAPIKLKGMRKQEACDKAMQLLEKVYLTDKALNYPSELSGGQQQRIAIARTLAMDPEMILFDEPTSALDPTMVQEVLSTIRHLSEQGMTMMIVTHEMRFARDISNRVLYMDQGVIYEEGSPSEIFENPVKDLTRRFIRHLSVFERTIEPESFDLYEFITAFEDFSMRNQISPKLKNRIYSILEEAGLLTILPKAEPGIPIELSVEYSESDETCTIDVRFAGRRSDFLSEMDKTSYNILMSQAFSIDHEYADGQNHIVAVIRR